MTVYISLLRGINVGGNRKIKMADLRDLYASLGLQHVKSYIQSGNVVFASDDDPDALEQRISEAIANRYGFEVSVMIRTLDEWRRILAQNPFDKPNIDPKTLHVTLLGQPPSAEAIAALEAADKGTEQFTVQGNTVYCYYPDGYGRSKLASSLEKTLAVRATNRNWNTMNKLLALTEAMES